MERVFSVIETEGRVPLKCWTNGVRFEAKALEQLLQLATMPFISAPIGVMPDVHVGIGSTVGSVVATSGAIIPAAAGVDLGCGMTALWTKIVASQLPDSMAKIRSAIEAMVPHGRSDDGGSNDRGAWREPPPPVQIAWNLLLKGEYEDGLVKKYPKLSRGATITQLGTLGTGNHFIEICLDEENRVWIVIHSGSRGPGNRIGTDFTHLARYLSKQWFINLPNPDLAYLPAGTEEFEDYLRAVRWSQKFASISREIMMRQVVGALVECGLDPGIPLVSDLDVVSSRMIDCRHNYIDVEHHYGKNVFVTRKGAIRARKGDLGIIPGSMGARSFIVRGLGSEDSLQSCSHGAGRAMSRTEAKKRFTVKDLAAATQGVECAKDASVLEEAPGAYKDIDAVMHAQRDLVEVVHTLHQIVCVKGGDD